MNEYILHFFKKMKNINDKYIRCQQLFYYMAVFVRWKIREENQLDSYIWIKELKEEYSEENYKLQYLKSCFDNNIFPEYLYEDIGKSEYYSVIEVGNEYEVYFNMSKLKTFLMKNCYDKDINILKKELKFILSDSDLKENNFLEKLGIDFELNSLNELYDEGVITEVDENASEVEIDLSYDENGKMQLKILKPLKFPQKTKQDDEIIIEAISQSIVPYLLSEYKNIMYENLKIDDNNEKLYKIINLLLYHF